ncbi:hypothetical protein [Zavarzinella formosa]|uniref:hypothetical protein n=1 Tax=Zavarzinella formosa TaxID=360055 RepID=UPI0002FC9B41|nr:hypothetical protein [Zavarzinella formosa]
MASVVETTIIVPISNRHAKNGGIDLHALAVAYLAVLKSATGQEIEGPLTDGSTIDRTSSQFVKFRRDEKGFLITPKPGERPLTFPPIPVPAYRESWEETDDASNVPDTRQEYVWGNKKFGLHTHNMGARLGMTWWQFFGLPKGREIKGFSDLNMYRAGSAELTLTGPTAWKTKLIGVFKATLEPWDQRREEDSLARLAIEKALTSRLSAGGFGPWDEVRTKELEEALAGSEPHSPAGMSVRFYLAVVYAGSGKIAEATVLLDQLPTTAGKLKFSHGISVVYEKERPHTVGWQDDFPGSEQKKEITHLRKFIKSLNGK